MPGFRGRGETLTTPLFRQPQGALKWESAQATRRPEAVPMPVHDWTRVDAGIFHAFHHDWITEISRALNCDLLPAAYYLSLIHI